MLSFALLLAVYAGFSHAFEADHLLAVSNIVSQRNSIKLSLRDGLFWGLGHTSTIFFMGILIIVFKSRIPAGYYKYFEATVGLMLIALAVHRLVRFFMQKSLAASVYRKDNAVHQPLPRQVKDHHKHQKGHSVAYGVGLIHGIAGSGAMILIVTSEITGVPEALIYLLIFGAGSTAGMALAAALFSIPFSKKILPAQTLHNFLILLSAIICLVFGSGVLYRNLYI